MHCPRPLLAMLAAALLPAAGPVTAGPARATDPLVVARQAAPAAALLAHDQPLGRQPLDTPVSMALTLPLRNTAALDTLLHRLYTPGDPLFGHYLTSAQFDAQFGPSQTDYDAVASYLRAQGLTVQTYGSRTLIGASGTSGTVESAFHVQMNQYKTASGRVAYTNTSSPLLPASIAARVSGVLGLDNLVLPHPHLVVRPPTSILSAAVGTGAGGGLSPTDIKRIYNLNNVSLAGEGQTMGLLELDGYDTGDVRQYITQFNLPINPNNTNTLINEVVPGFTGPSGTLGQVEVALDIDMMLALAPRINHIYVYEANNNTTIGILELLTLMANDNYAQSISCSWAQAEDIVLLEQGTTQYTALLNAEDTQLRKMSAQGQSFFTAAGDAGAYADEPYLGTAATISVNDPPNQPYATAVGGTKVNVTNPGTATIGYGSETTWNEGVGDAGGGGFSSFFNKPFYQYSSGSTANPVGAVGATGGTSDVLSTITLTLPPHPQRDLPDVSLNADPTTGYTIYAAITGQPFTVVGGTSAAAPLWAAFTALANEARAADAIGVNPGQSPGLPASPVGFINPLIYRIGYGQYGSYANDFHDIADGSSNLVYVAQYGFDDATGWGSFNGANLLRDLAAYAPNTAVITAPAVATFPPGIQMISEPEQFSGQTFAALFGLASPIPTGGPELFQYQAQTQTYATSDFSLVGPHVNTLIPGQGYWLYVPTASAPGLTLAVAGATPAAPVTVALQAGWNQIGDPFPTAESLSNVSVTNGADTTPLPSAGASIYGTLFSYPAGATQYTSLSATQVGAALQPTQGYWVYAFQAGTLTFN